MSVNSKVETTTRIHTSARDGKGKHYVRAETILVSGLMHDETEVEVTVEGLVHADLVIPLSLLPTLTEVLLAHAKQIKTHTSGKE